VYGIYLFIYLFNNNKHVCRHIYLSICIDGCVYLYLKISLLEQKLSAELGVKCIETSAKDAKNVDAAFFALLDGVLERRDRDGVVEPSTTAPINIGKTKKVESGCSC